MIRAACQDDIPALLGFAHAMVAEADNAQRPVDEPYCRKVIEALITDPDSLLLLQEQANNAPSGFVLGRLRRELHNPQPFLHVVHLYIRPEHRSLKTVLHLLRTLFAVARGQTAPDRLSHIEMSTTQAKISQADERLWRLLGFEKVGFTLWAASAAENSP